MKIDNLGRRSCGLFGIRVAAILESILTEMKAVGNLTSSVFWISSIIMDIGSKRLENWEDENIQGESFLEAIARSVRLSPTPLCHGPHRDTNVGQNLLDSRPKTLFLSISLTARPWGASALPPTRIFHTWDNPCFSLSISGFFDCTNQQDVYEYI